MDEFQVGDNPKSCLVRAVDTPKDCLRYQHYSRSIPFSFFRMSILRSSQLWALCFILLKGIDAFQMGGKTMNRGYSLSMVATSIEKKRVVIVGATGYIGKFVVKESIRRGKTPPSWRSVIHNKDWLRASA